MKQVPKTNHFFLLFFLLFSTFNLAHAQDFMMQGWYWDYPKTANGFNWADTLENKANELGQAGFTYMWLPPLSRASFGSASNGYDPQDLYDLGIPSVGATGFGTRTQVDDVISAFNNAGVQSVADVIYNHRDGGAPEDNPSVEGWIENLNCTKVNAGDNAYPTDRFRCYLPLGGASGNGAGTYYFKLRSASLHPNYYGRAYKLYMETNTTGFQGLPEDNEDESGGGNGGGDCGQGNNTIQLGVDMIGSIDNVGSCGGFCGIDEFQLTINNSDFNAAGDTLWIYMNNSGGNYSDHYIIGLWDGSADIQSQIRYQTYTDYTNMPSGRGGMDYTYFKPNGNPTQLNGDWDWMWFFYDYDQSEQKTADSLNVWSKWLWEEVGIRGYRMDAVKHFDYAYTGDLMDYLHDNGIDPGMVVGEFFDNNPFTLTGWVNNVEANMDTDTKNAIKVRAFDFALRSALKDACDAFGYDVRNVFNSGMVDAGGISGFNTVTFVNNHDFRDAGQPVQNDPMLAYAYILTNNQLGLPSVFYPDYYQANIPNAPGTYLKEEIDELIDVHQTYIYQSGSVDYLSRIGTPYTANYIAGFDHTTLLYQLSGGVAGKEVIVAINFAGETLKVDHGINMTNLAEGDTLKDILGHSNFDFALVDANQQIYIELAPRSYSVWISAPNLSPLPATLTNFEVFPKPDYVQLKWESENEINLSVYEVERSLDGQKFEKIGLVEATGSGTYLFEDRAPVFNQPMYYRLKLLDLDGKYNFSEIRTLKLEKNINDLALVPNPVNQISTLTFNSLLNGTASIQLYDTRGRLISGSLLSVHGGENHHELNLELLQSGIYIIQIKMGAYLNQLKLVKL